MKEEWAKLVPELYVSNIKTSLDFYVGVLGFCIKYERPEDGFAYLDKEGAQIMLEETEDTKPNKRLWVTGELTYPLGRGINLQIEISNVDELYQTVAKTTNCVYLEIEEKWYRAGNVLVGCKQFIVQDTDGYLLRFYSDLGEKPVENS